MGRLYRKRNRQGALLPRWYVEYTDAAGKRRFKAGYRDKEATKQLLARLEREAAQGREGLVDPYAEANETPLAQHAADFDAHLQARGVSEKHRRQTVRRLRAALEEMGAAWPKDMTTRKAERFLVRLVENGASAKTRNDYLAILLQFGTWGVREKRWRENPFAPIPRLNVEADADERRALTLDELRRLCEAAKTRAYREAVELYPAPDAARKLKAKRLAEGEERSVIYLTAGLSGLRLNELATLTWGDLDLEAGCVTVQARYAKSRRKTTTPLPAELVEALRAWREEAIARGRPVGEGDRVFRITSKLGRHHFHLDAEAAGIPRVDDAGRVLVFHSLRHTYATLLSRAGVAPRVAQMLMRHADLKTTMRTYTHLELLDARRALEALPPVMEPEEETEVEELRAAAGAESVAREARYVARKSRPEVSKHGQTWPSEAGEADSRNPRFSGENSSTGGNLLPRAMGVKSWRRRESNPKPLVLKRRETPDSSPSTGGADFEARYVARNERTDPQLKAVADAWPGLPQAIRNAILALVDSAKGEAPK